MTGDAGWAAEEYVLFRKSWLNALGRQTHSITEVSLRQMDREKEHSTLLTSPISEARHTLLQSSLTSGVREIHR